MNLILTKDTQQDLNDIRALVITKDYQAFRSDRNRLKLSEVYREVMAFSGFNVDPISGSCSGCINEPVNVVYNYVMHHEQLPDNREAKVIEVAGGGTRAWGTDNKYPEGLLSRIQHEPVTMTHETITSENIIDKAQEIYDNDIKAGGIPRVVVKESDVKSVNDNVPVIEFAGKGKGSTGEYVGVAFGYDVSNLHLYAPYTKEDLLVMDYSSLMELAKHHGHTGKRISKEALIEYLTDKVIPKSE